MAENNIKKNKATHELLFSITKKDFRIQTFRSGGKGGQHQNKIESGVRIFHDASGVKGESRSARSQHQNKKLAFRRLINSPKFQVWLKRVVHECSSTQTTEDWIEEQMQPQNIKIEIKKDGKWQKIA